MTRPYSECCRGSGRLAHIQICSIVSTASFLVSVHLLLIWISNYSLSLVLGRLFSCTQMFMECWNFLVTVRWLMIGLVHIILGNQSVQCLILKCIQVMISVVQTKQPCQCLVSMLTSFYSPPPPPQIQEVQWNHFVRLSVCSSVYVSNLVCSVSPEALNHFLPNLVWWCIIMRRCVMRKNWFTIFNVKVTVRANKIKIWLFLLYLLNCWSICNQTWFDSTASQAGMSCGKMGLLRSRSRSQWRFKMFVNVCPHIFWTTEYFVTKPGYAAS